MSTSQLTKNMLNKLKRLFGRKPPKKDVCYYQPQIVKGIVMEDVVDKLNELNQGDRIRAVIRHVNPDLGLSDSYVVLTNEEDVFLTDDCSELNYNWHIINFELLNKQEK